MKAVFATLTAIAMLGAFVVAPVVMAQTQAPAGAVKTIEGQVMTIDPAGKSLTLSDGTKLTVPESVKVSGDLKPGAKVKAAYEEKGGQKILTDLEVAK